MNKGKHNLSGFTLVELMMAIAVIAILASTLYFSVLGYTARARDTTRATDLRKVAQGLDGYFTAHDVYPPTTCGIDGYDCINIDSGSFITSTESAWSTAPLAYSSSPFLSSSPLDAFLVLLSPVSYADTVPLPPGALETALVPYMGNNILPRDPINNATFPWVDKKSYVYSYGNVGKLKGQVGYDLTATLENPNNQIACKNRPARYGYNNTALCNPADPNSDAVVNPGFTGVHHSLLYEAGTRDGKFDVALTDTQINYEWVAGVWGAYQSGGAITCGQDTRTRTVTCYRKSDNQGMDDSFCDAATKPATSTTDEIGSATCGWSAWSGWGVCSVGTQTETRTCNPLALNHCTPNPNGTSETQSCGTPASVTAWSTCSGGNQTRTCTEAVGGGSPTCAGLGATVGVNNQSCGTPAVCDTTTLFACSVGTSVSNVANSCGQNATWGCNSTDGGTNTTATTCSKANSACINGVCNSVFNSYTLPTATCATGTPTSVIGSGPWTWGCNSPNGGTSTAANACSANKSVDGGCNNATQYACANGTTSVSNVAGSCGGSSTWGCNGINGGTSTAANACSKANVACPVNGSCGGSANTCGAGSPSGYSGGSCGGSKTWSCVGLYGGSTAGCSIANAACPVATCNNSVALGCTTGTSLSDGGQVACGTTHTWYCGGSGYQTSGQCSKANAACPVNGSCGGSANTCGAGSPSGYSGGSCGGSQTWTCNGANGGSNASCSIANGACATYSVSAPSTYSCIPYNSNTYYMIPSYDYINASYPITTGASCPTQGQTYAGFNSCNGFSGGYYYDCTCWSQTCQ